MKNLVQSDLGPYCLQKKATDMPQPDNKQTTKMEKV